MKMSDSDLKIEKYKLLQKYTFVKTIPMYHRKN